MPGHLARSLAPPRRAARGLPSIATRELAAVAEAGDAHGGRDRFGVGVVEDDGGGLAAEFETHLLEVRPASRGDPATDGGGPGERNPVDTGMVHESLADRAVARQDAHESRR
jgi:hypothetical protein